MLTSILYLINCQIPGLKYELENIKIPDDADCKRIHDYLTN